MTPSFNETKARLLEENAIPFQEFSTLDVTGNVTLKRAFPDILMEEMSIGQLFLNKWGTVKNYTNDSTPVNHTITDPMIGGKTISGSYLFSEATAYPMPCEDQQSPVRYFLVQVLVKIIDDTSSGGTGVDRVSDSYSDDAFSSSRGVEHKGQAAPLKDSVCTPQVVGQKVAIRNNLDEKSGTWKTEQSTELAHEGETPDHVVTIRHDGLTISDRDIKHIDPAISPPAWTAAPTAVVALTGVTVERQLNPFKGQSVSKKTLTQAEVALAEISWTVEEGTVFLRRYFGVTTANLPARMEAFSAKIATHHISGTPTFDAVTGTWDIVLIANPKPSSYSQSGGAVKAFDTTWTSYEWRQKQTSAGLVVTRREAYACGMIQSKSESSTRAFISGKGNAEINALGKWGFRGTYKNLVGLTSFETTETGVPAIP